MVGRLDPDVLVTDLSLPGPDGLTLARRLQARSAKVRVVVFSMHSDEWHLRRALRAGASAYVAKDSSTTEVVAAVRSAAVGQHHVSIDLLQHVIESYIASPADPEPADLRLIRPR